MEAFAAFIVALKKIGRNASYLLEVNNSSIQCSSTFKNGKKGDLTDFGNQTQFWFYMHIYNRIHILNTYKRFL